MPHWQETWMNFMQHAQQRQAASLQDMWNVGEIYQDWLTQLVGSPDVLCDVHSTFFQEYCQFWVHYQEKILGAASGNYIASAPSDKRFRSSDWNENPFFYFYQQLYLLFTKHCIDFVEKNPGNNPKLAKQVSFFSRQALNALSPSNFILTNPDVLKCTLETQGENLSKGYQKFLDDLSEGKGHWTIEMSDKRAFEIGRNIAITKGKVIFQNKLFQLIQYSPQTKTVYEVPLVIIPPWINKYYILDLRENNSFVKWIVEQGHTVFLISWVNPDSTYRDTTFEAYLFEGLLTALEVACDVTKQKKANMLGFCVGGTLLGVALAYLRRKKQSRIQSATFLTTLIDFAQPGDIEVFLDERQISELEKQMAKEGYLDGRTMTMTFSMLRSNDLYWSYFVNNYLCGKDPFPFDFLYWNTDATHLPAAMHSYYLRKFYLENCFYKGNLEMGGERLVWKENDVPSYFLATEQDHIAPWQATFSGALALEGEVEFVVGGSGHVAGVINPPSARKYGYRTNLHSPLHVKDSTAWMTSSEYHDGSWWEHWEHWLSRHAGQKISKRSIGNARWPVLQEAPGDYVKKKIS